MKRRLQIDRRVEHVTVIGNDDRVSWAVIKKLDEKKVPCYGPLKSFITCSSHVGNGVILMILSNGKESLETLVELGFLFHDCHEAGRDLFCVIEDYQDKNSLANRAREIVKAHAKKFDFDVFDNVDAAVAQVAELFG